MLTLMNPQKGNFLHAQNLKSEGDSVYEERSHPSQ